MNRQTMLLGGLGAALVLVVFWLFLYSPKSSELSDTHQQIDDAKSEQIRLTNQINELRDLRREAPALEARLAAGEVLLPSDAAVPAVLRQFQVAADDAAVRLINISPARPTDADLAGVQQMTIAVTLEGSYFQLVDFLRRIEDPAITPRAVLWNNMSVSVAEYPTLQASLTGVMFVMDREALAGAGGGG